MGLTMGESVDKSKRDGALGTLVLSAFASTEDILSGVPRPRRWSGRLVLSPRGGRIVIFFCLGPVEGGVWMPMLRRC